MNEEAKRLLTEYRRCEARLEELSHKLRLSQDEYKEKLKDSLSQDGMIDFEKQIRSIVNDYNMYRALNDYRDAIREVLRTKFDITAYSNSVEVSDSYFGIESIKPNISYKKDKKEYIPEHVRSEVVELIKSVVNDMLGEKIDNIHKDTEEFIKNKVNNQ